MATTLTLTQLKRDDLVALGSLSTGDTAGNVVPNGGFSFVYVDNTIATAGTLTVAFARTVDGQAVTARVITVPASFKGFLRVGAVGDYGANVTVTPSATTINLKAFGL